MKVKENFIDTTPVLFLWLLIKVVSMKSNIFLISKSENISLQSRLAQLQNLQNLLITLTDFHESYEVENMSVPTKCLHNLPFSLLASI